MVNEPSGFEPLKFYYMSDLSVPVPCYHASIHFTFMTKRVLFGVTRFIPQLKAGHSFRFFFFFFFFNLKEVLYSRYEYRVSMKDTEVNMQM